MHRYTILIVDDDPLTRKLFRLTLTREGHHVIEAATCRAAREHAVAHSLDLIITDLRLPDGRGVVLAQWMRARPALSEVPILAVSGVDGMLQSAAALRHLFTDFFLKPIALSVLRQVVRRHLPAEHSPVPGEDLLVHQYQTAQALARRAVHSQDQLAVLASMTEVLSRTTDLDSLLSEGLERYLDAGGFSLGAVYLWHHDHGLQLTGQAGCSPGQLEPLSDLFGHPERLLEALESVDALTLSAAEGDGDLLERAGYASMVLVPMAAEHQLLGVLLLASGEATFARKEVAFARAIQTQITLAVVLATVQAQRDVFWRAFLHIADASPVGVITRRSGELEYLNASARRLLGGMRGYRQLLHLTLPEEGVRKVDLRLPDGTSRPIQLAVSRFQDRFGVRYERWLVEERRSVDAQTV